MYVTEGVIDEHLEHTSSASNLAEPNSSLKTIEVEGRGAISLINGLVQPTEASCSNVKSDEQESLFFLQGTFKQHLTFTAAQYKKKQAKQKLPSAFLAKHEGSITLNHPTFTKKANEAKSKLGEKQKRKEDRQLKKENKKTKDTECKKRKKKIVLCVTIN